MKIAIYAPIALWEVHLAQAIEIAHSKHLEGNDVVLIHCQGSLVSCAANMSHEERKCRECRIQTKFSISNHFPNSTRHVNLMKKNIESELEQDILNINTMEKLREFTFENRPFGLSVISHLVTEERDWELSFEDTRSKAHSMLMDGIEHYLGMKDILKQDFDLLYVFGGRRTSEAIGVFAAESLGVPVRYFEHGAGGGKFLITEHKHYTLKGVKKEIESWREKFWYDENIIEERKLIGEKYFSSLLNRRHNDPHFRHFLEEYNEVPNIETTRPILAIFTSSLWEFAGFDEDLDCPPDFRDQYSLYERMGRDSELLKTHTIIFRWHPALKFAGQREKRRMREVIERTKECIHIKPEEKANSYLLVNAAEIVITVGSTIGIESAAMGKNSILLGNASYSGIGAVHEPKSYLDFKELIRKNLPALPKERAFIYGDWASSRGSEFNFIDQDGLRYFLKGVRIQKRSLVYEIKRWLFEKRENILSSGFKRV